jgi:hypothetical protein
MKSLSAPLLAIVLAGFCTPAVGSPLELIKRLATPQSDETPPPAAEPPAGEPTHRVAVAAPRLDATAPPVEIDPPIPAGTIEAPEAPTTRSPDPGPAKPRRRRAESKSVIHKFKELKRSLFGR